MNDFQQYLTFQKERVEAELKVINRHFKGTVAKKQKGTSNMDLVEKVLRAAGGPLHISEIIIRVEADFSVRLERDSVVSNLVKKIRAGHRFKRTAPNTFTVME